MPRIISGTVGGIRLDAPSGLKTRPTADRAKEALFSILGEFSSEDVVLDIYSGSGSLGLEALSRGAKKCYFIDRNPKSAAVIRKNIEKCGLPDKSEIIRGDSFKTIEHLKSEGLMFNVVFMDPPYGHGLVPLTIEKIGEADIIDSDGVIIAEHEPEGEPPDMISGFVKYDTRGYGTVRFSFYKPIGPSPGTKETE